ncbi:MAG: Rpn family recombination-promoting nuclease/putative transposase [Okeania sp. SIO2C9]|uniref:Rpn family recombination-promoting nuclease/putative transposase n=1 Tax=Okeania sp. SIO2C9 TaxID=2607791 RepID=UPI0013C1C3A8|nr:Rpn family recombination-promoting nuclease/putative transposase [Okeania sp. SIO2C9]NEQ77137.1 Rpn family recombination-promoting nuclease/putative transposase [Okeania sp. SIO2C9]
MRFISPKTDFAFKKIFGSTESKDILISFLNALIYYGESIIQDLEIIDPYNPGDIISLKDSYLDVKVVLNDGSNVIIEVQVLSVPAFEKRVVYNLCKTYGNQLSTGQGYRQLKPVIALTITDFEMFDETAEYINHFVFKEKNKLFDYRPQEVAMIFVELPKFPKQLKELESLSDKWIYFMKEAPSLEVIPNSLAKVKEIKKALNIANQANLSRKELEEVHKREMFLEDRTSEIILARQEAREEGREEGLEEGLEVGKLSMQRLILAQLERRFSGEITGIIRENIQLLSMEKLEDLGGAILSFNRLEDLSNWLAEFDGQ